MLEQPLFTIGYEGATPDRLIETLREAGVTTLVDVRELANSRRPTSVSFAGLRDEDQKSRVSRAVQRSGVEA